MRSGHLLAVDVLSMAKLDSALWRDMMEYLRRRHAPICRQWFEELQPISLEAARPQIVRFLTYDQIRDLLEKLRSRSKVEVLVKTDAPSQGVPPADAPKLAPPPPVAPVVPPAPPAAKGGAKAP